MSADAAVAALKRARVRIGMNGWQQGSSQPVSRGTHRPLAMGWCLEEAVRGRGKRKLDSAEQVYGPGEAEALSAIESAIAEFHMDELTLIEEANPPSIVVAWNDKSGRTRDEVLAVLTLAERQARPFDSRGVSCPRT
jgi:hypothetical protein